MRLVDTHSHLYHADLQPDMQEVLQRCKQQQIRVVILPNINEDSIAPMNTLAALSDNELLLLPAMGLHPCDVKENVQTQLQFFKQAFKDKNYVAVGETGLDYYWDVSLKEQQQIAFQTQIEWSVEMQLPLIIHSRNATSDCIDMVANFNGKAKGVFHCFAGTIAEAEAIISMGFYLGIGGSLTYKNSNELREVVKHVGIENILLETDAPYLPPVPYRGKRNESSYVSIVAEHIATLKNMAIGDVSEITTKNAQKLFAFSI
ncbi:MAG: TatD family hydrolase [Chitinophagales bacterium]|nr:TatD family hydrolase [Chitinophagales bacterium]